MADKNKPSVYARRTSPKREGVVQRYRDGRTFSGEQLAKLRAHVPAAERLALEVKARAGDVAAYRELKQRFSITLPLLEAELSKKGLWP